MRGVGCECVVWGTLLVRTRCNGERLVNLAVTSH